MKRNIATAGQTVTLYDCAESRAIPFRVVSCCYMPFRGVPCCFVPVPFLPIPSSSVPFPSRSVQFRPVPVSFRPVPIPFPSRSHPVPIPFRPVAVPFPSRSLPVPSRSSPSDHGLSGRPGHTKTANSGRAGHGSFFRVTPGANNSGRVHDRSSLNQTAPSWAEIRMERSAGRPRQLYRSSAGGGGGRRDCGRAGRVRSGGPAARRTRLFWDDIRTAGGPGKREQ